MCQQETKDWIEDIVEKTVKNYNGREVVIWGKYEVGDAIKEELQKRHEIDVAFFVDGDVAKIDNVEVFSPDKIMRKNDTYYVIIPLAFYQGIKEKLKGGGYEQHKDYYYFCDCILQQEADYYEDAHGNKIFGRYQGLKFAFTGFNSVIEIEGNVHFVKSAIYIHNNAKVIINKSVEIHNSTITIHSGAKVVISDNTKIRNSVINSYRNSELLINQLCCFAEFSMIIGEQTTAVFGENVKIDCSGWITGKKSKLEIGNKGVFHSGSIFLEDGAMIVIGKEFTIRNNFRIHGYNNTRIIIGDDCMFSYDVIMRSNDGHSIFDIETGERINSAYDIRNDRNIIIGNHVWMGERAYVLYGARVGDGSMIGAMSFVKSKIPNNCIAAGIPIRVIRKNIAWSRRDIAENIAECEKETMIYTQ